MNRKSEEYWRSFPNDKKFYDENTHSLLCPKCYNYSVEYFNNLKKWSCNTCETVGNIYYKINVILTDKDKYHIYKFWGVEALSQLTYESLGEIKKFVGSYFKKGCSSVGEKCIYSDYFKEKELSKQIKSIENLFDKTRREYGLLIENIDGYIIFKNEKHFLSDEIKKEVEVEYIRLKKKIEQIDGKLDDDDFLIAVANTDLSKDQRVFVKEYDGDLIADLNSINGVEFFVWNDAKKSDMVGVATLQIKSLTELKQLNEEFTEKYRKVILENHIDILDKLPPLEREIFYLILRENSILQNLLWKKFKIDSSKCSRIVKSMTEKNLIIKDRVKSSNGSYTYLLSIKK